MITRRIAKLAMLATVPRNTAANSVPSAIIHAIGMMPMMMVIVVMVVMVVKMTIKQASYTGKLLRAPAPIPSWLWEWRVPGC
jgi:hypothetical protein